MCVSAAQWMFAVSPGYFFSCLRDGVFGSVCALSSKSSSVTLSTFLKHLKLRNDFRILFFKSAKTISSGPFCLIEFFCNTRTAGSTLLLGDWLFLEHSVLEDRAF